MPQWKVTFKVPAGDRDPPKTEVIEADRLATEHGGNLTFEECGNIKVWLSYRNVDRVDKL